MYSSRRSSRSEATGSCPTCGSTRVIAVIEDVILPVGGRKRRFAQVPHEKCLACGERIFGLEASKLFDAALPSRRRRGRPAA